MSKTKIIAMYLPQYHQIPENDEFWGKGFTDWVTVKNAKPLFDGHQQPRVPLNDNYYDLSLKENVAWQAKLAREYGIYGFGIYHYWFNNEKNLLTKPSEIILANKDIDINFHFAWDNTFWKRSWSNVKGGNAWTPLMEENMAKGDKSSSVMIPYILGTEKDWANHYNYLSPFFHDHRYIRKNGKPVFIIYHYSPQIGEMCNYWDELAKKEGLDGVCFIFRYARNENVPANENVMKYEPLHSGWIEDGIKGKIKRKIQSKTGWGMHPQKFDYDIIWERILSLARKMTEENIYHGAFVRYDDTPRRGLKGKLILGASPEKFEKYLFELFEISESQHKEFIFLTAMNEWGEGAYLEPDNISGYKYLEAIKRINNDYEK